MNANNTWDRHMNHSFIYFFFAAVDRNVRHSRLLHEYYFVSAAAEKKIAVLMDLYVHIYIDICGGLVVREWAIYQLF